MAHSVEACDAILEACAARGLKSTVMFTMRNRVGYVKAKEALDSGRLGRVLEIRTYRYRGHSMSDPAKYRTAEELESHKKQDPILILKDALEAEGTLGADEYAAMPYELHVDDNAWWGDFYSFWLHGYCAVNHEEAWYWGDPDFNPYYHTTAETPDKLAPEFFAGCVRTAVGALATLAGAADVTAVPAQPGGAAALVASPNPFNGKVVLRLTADGVEGPRAVRVYDLRGRRVGQVTVAMRGGVGEAAWDAQAGAGRALPAGVYLARADGVPGRAVCRVMYVP